MCKHTLTHSYRCQWINLSRELSTTLPLAPSHSGLGERIGREKVTKFVG